MQRERVTATSADARRLQAALKVKRPSVTMVCNDPARLILLL